MTGAMGSLGLMVLLDVDHICIHTVWYIYIYVHIYIYMRIYIYAHIYIYSVCVCIYICNYLYIILYTYEPCTTCPGDRDDQRGSKQILFPAKCLRFCGWFAAKTPVVGS